MQDVFKTLANATRPKQLPKYFVIKWSDSPLWDDFIDWLNNTHGTDFDGKEHGYYGVDKNGGFTSMSLIYVGEPEITIEQWNEIVNGNKEVAEPKGKLKLKVDILGNGRMLKTLIDFVANHNSGKVPIDLNVIESYLEAEMKRFPRSNNGTAIKKGNEGELLISDNNGETHYLVISEVFLYPLLNVPTLDRQGILNEEQHELIN